jgi:hypothetical protein
MEAIQEDNDGLWYYDRLRQVHELALLGVTEEAMIKVMGIGATTFSRWKLEKEGFADALNEGRMVADARVAAALYKRATGYEVDEDHVSIFKGVAVVTTVRRHIPADPWSAARWLSLRQRAMWSETQRVEITNTNVNIHKLDTTGLSLEELKLLEGIGLKQLKTIGHN